VIIDQAQKTPEPFLRHSNLDQLERHVSASLTSREIRRSRRVVRLGLNGLAALPKK
jgi:hypothetical protein